MNDPVVGQVELAKAWELGQFVNVRRDEAVERQVEPLERLKPGDVLELAQRIALKVELFQRGQRAERSKRRLQSTSAN